LTEVCPTDQHLLLPSDRSAGLSEKLHRRAEGAALAHSAGRAAPRRSLSGEHYRIESGIVVAQAVQGTDRVVRGKFYHRHSVRTRVDDASDDCALTSVLGGPALVSSRHVLFDVR
jgi:hypothetical protein